MTRKTQEETCEICLEPINRQFTNSSRCSHPFCTDCITSYIKAKLEDHHPGNIKCPDLNCNEFLDPISCRTVIGPSLFVKWCDVLCESAIAGINKCYCPNRDCNALILNECNGDGGIDVKKKARCPNCNKRFCFNCLRDWSPWHSLPWSSRCEDVVDDQGFNRLAAKRNWRRCPRCRFFIEPGFGSGFVRCRCGNFFCYQCGGTSHVAHRCIRPELIDSIPFADLISYALLVFVMFLALFEFFRPSSN